MNIYEIITKESRGAYRYTRVAASSAPKAYVIFETKFRGLARFITGEPLLVESRVDRDLAVHYGCVNVDDVNWERHKSIKTEAA